MATYIPLQNTPLQFVDNSGDPLVSGTLEFFLAGTTTATNLFADSSGTSIGSSITLNAWGMPEAGGNTITLFRDQSSAIKIVGKNAAGATIWTADNIPAVASFDSTSSTKLDGIEALADVTDATNVAAAGALFADGSVSMTGDLTMTTTTFINQSVAAGLTASVTQTQAGGLALVNAINEIATVANSGDAVVLPTPVAGRSVWVFNNGANPLQVFPSSDTYINENAINASITQGVAANAEYKAISATEWETQEPGSVNASYATMYDESNGDAFVINAQTDPHVYHTNGLADGGSQGWTFDAGGAGTSFPIASIADGVASGTDIEVTTTGSHGLAVGDIVSQTNLASAVYTGIFKVKAIISATQYEVAGIYTATDTGTMDQAATLTAGTEAAGTYTLQWSVSSTTASASEIVDHFFYLHATAIARSSCRRKFGTGGDIGAMGVITPRFTVAAGQKVSFVIVNTTGAGNMTIRNHVVTLNKDLV